MATTFPLKQGETRTSHGPIPHPLNSLGTCSHVQCMCQSEPAPSFPVWCSNWEYSGLGVLGSPFYTCGFSASNWLVHWVGLVGSHNQKCHQKWTKMTLLQFSRLFALCTVSPFAGRTSILSTNICALWCICC